MKYFGDGSETDGNSCSFALEYQLQYHLNLLQLGCGIWYFSLSRLLLSGVCYVASQYRHMQSEKVVVCGIWYLITVNIKKSVQPCTKHCTYRRACVSVAKEVWHSTSSPPHSYVVYESHCIR